MARRKVTLSLPDHTVTAAQHAAAKLDTPFSAYVARALRNETLRQQLALAALPDDSDWVATVESDEAGAA